jgi:hypothetical protein
MQLIRCRKTILNSMKHILAPLNLPLLTNRAYIEEICFWPKDIEIKPRIKYLAYIDTTSALSSLYDVIYNGKEMTIEVQIRILKR